MKKEILRRFALTLRNDGKSYLEIKDAIKKQFNIDIDKRTLRRWWKRLCTTEWDFKDTSQRPHTIHYKFTSEHKKTMVNYRKSEGYSSQKLRIKLQELRS